MLNKIERKMVNIFLTISPNICFGCSKEHILMGKRNATCQIFSINYLEGNKISDNS